MKDKRPSSTPISVKCYSGHVYAERPESFTWEGQTLKVQRVKRAWQEPGERHFLVSTDEDTTFELCYEEINDCWSAVEVIR